MYMYVVLCVSFGALTLTIGASTRKNQSTNVQMMTRLTFYSRNRDTLTSTERLNDVHGLLTGAVIGRCVCWIWTNRVQVLTSKHRWPDQQTSAAGTW